MLECKMSKALERASSSLMLVLFDFATGSGFYGFLRSPLFFDMTGSLLLASLSTLPLIYVHCGYWTGRAGETLNCATQPRL